MLINVRGTSGTGKSWVMYQLMERYNAEPITDETLPSRSKTSGYTMADGNVAIIGRYESACGGCDTIKSPALVVERLEQFYREFPIVIFEGLVVSHTFQRYADVADRYKEETGEETHFLFLDTPLKKCIGRVRKRRHERGNTKPFDPFKNPGLATDWHQVWNNTRRSFIDNGYNVQSLNHQDPLPQVTDLIDTALSAL